jgi:hypothetical protein
MSIMHSGSGKLAVLLYHRNIRALSGSREPPETGAPAAA